MNTVVSTIHYSKCSTLGVGFLERYSNSIISLLCCPNYKYQHATEQNIASPSTPQHGFLALPSGGLVLKGFIVSGIEWGSLRFVEVRLLSSTQRGLTGLPESEPCALSCRKPPAVHSLCMIQINAPSFRAAAAEWTMLNSSEKWTEGPTDTD